MARILVVEDDPTVAEVVVSYLRRAGHEVEHAPEGESALVKAAPAPPDLVVLDLMLPGLDGLEVCRRLRTHGDPHVVMLTALGEESERILGLEVGADDYVTKPFSPRELVLRVQSVLRRTGSGIARGGGVPTGPRTLCDGELALDVGAHSVTSRGRELSMTSREFDHSAWSRSTARPGRTRPPRLLSFSYRHRRVLNVQELHMGEGVAGLLGPNRAGKTTLGRAVDMALERVALAARAEVEVRCRCEVPSSASATPSDSSGRR